MGKGGRREVKGGGSGSVQQIAFGVSSMIPDIINRAGAAMPRLNKCYTVYERA